MNTVGPNNNNCYKHQNLLFHVGRLLELLHLGDPMYIVVKWKKKLSDDHFEHNGLYV